MYVCVYLSIYPSIFLSFFLSLSPPLSLFIPLFLFLSLHTAFSVPLSPSLSSLSLLLVSHSLWPLQTPPGRGTGLLLLDRWNIRHPAIARVHQPRWLSTASYIAKPGYQYRFSHNNLHSGSCTKILVASDQLRIWKVSSTKCRD